MGANTILSKGSSVEEFVHQFISLITIKMITKRYDDAVCCKLKKSTKRQQNALKLLGVIFGWQICENTAIPSHSMPTQPTPCLSWLIQQEEATMSDSRPCIKYSWGLHGTLKRAHNEISERINLGTSKNIKRWRHTESNNYHWWHTRCGI